MKRILAVIGSPNDEKSNTATMVRDFVETIRRIDPAIECEVLSLGKRRIEPCRGCWSCMKTGSCVFGGDALPEITGKMLECDFLIIGSPVYEQLISAQTKALFDRTYMWIHLIRAMGKPAMTAITTCADGIWLAERYLGTIMTMMGFIVLGHLRGIGKQPGVFPDRERCKAKHEKLARRVVDILNGKRRLRPGMANRLCYLFMRHHTRRLVSERGADSGYRAYELQYWKGKDWFRLSYDKALQRENASRA
jgi:multimeric flavodoxin WrbA